MRLICLFAISLYSASFSLKAPKYLLPTHTHTHTHSLSLSLIPVFSLSNFPLRDSSLSLTRVSLLKWQIISIIEDPLEDFPYPLPIIVKTQKRETKKSKQFWLLSSYQGDLLLLLHRKVRANVFNSTQPIYAHTCIIYILYFYVNWLYDIREFKSWRFNHWSWTFKLLLDDLYLQIKKLEMKCNVNFKLELDDLYLQIKS